MRPKKVDKLECNECGDIVEEADIKKVTAYKNDDYCEEISEDAEDLVTEIEAFKCPSCDALQESKDELFETVERFECGECGEVYEDREESKECCK